MRALCGRGRAREGKGSGAGLRGDLGGESKDSPPSLRDTVESGKELADIVKSCMVTTRAIDLATMRIYLENAAGNGPRSDFGGLERCG